MDLMKNKTLLFNGAALLIIGATGAAMVRSLFHQEVMAPCSERYEAGLRMSVARGAEPMSASDLQARFAGQDWGLLEHARVIQAKGAPASFALELDAAPEQKIPDRRHVMGDGPAPERPGVGFLWSPQAMKTPAGACLAYAMRLPDGFAAAGGGRLPGLQGREAAEGQELDQGRTFTLRPRWSPEGKLQVVADVPAAAEHARNRKNPTAAQDDTERSGPDVSRSGGILTQGDEPLVSARPEVALPRGRWVTVEQEMVLNAPGQENGILRIWLDGTLAFERTDLVIRRQPNAGFTSVFAEFAAFGQQAKTPVEARRLQVTPFELHWK